MEKYKGMDSFWAVKEINNKLLVLVAKMKIENDFGKFEILEKEFGILTAQFRIIIAQLWLDKFKDRAIETQRKIDE